MKTTLALGACMALQMTSVVLGALAASAAAYIGFLVAASAAAFVPLRGLAGSFGAGLIPAVMGTLRRHPPERTGGSAAGWTWHRAGG